LSRGFESFRTHYLFKASCLFNVLETSASSLSCCPFTPSGSGALSWWRSCAGAASKRARGTPHRQQHFRAV